MKVIPVLDILGRQAVHAVRGRRDEYHPMRSVLSESAKPLDIARAFRKFGFEELYVADLDAILGKSSNVGLLRRIKAETDLSIMVDAGVSDLRSAERLFKSGISEVILGSETLRRLDFVGDAITRFGEDRVIASLDLIRGRVVARSESINSMNPLMFATMLEEMGVRKIIVLDLQNVGSREGVELQVPKQILRKLELKVITGGGVRHIRDLKKLKEIGVSGALVATVLHTGILSQTELRSAGFL